MKNPANALLAVALLLLGGSAHPFWNPAGARAIRHTEFPTLYYQTNSERTKAYVFYTDHPLLIVGMAVSSKWDEEAEKIGISFGGVRKTQGHIQEYGASPVADYRVGNLFVTELDIYVGKNGNPDDQFQLFYITEKGPWEHRIPYRGLVDRTKLQNKTS